MNQKEKSEKIRKVQNLKKEYLNNESERILKELVAKKKEEMRKKEEENEGR